LLSASHKNWSRAWSKYYIAAKTGCFIKRILCGSCTSFEGEIDNQDLNCNTILPIDRNPKERAYIYVDPSLLTLYAGIYKSVEKSRDKFSIFMDNGHLTLQDNEGSFKSELYAESLLDFFLKEDNLQIEFIKDKIKRVTGLTLYLDAKEIRFKKKK
jgi:hypothetical protein